MINKKAQAQPKAGFNVSAGLVLALFLGVVLIIFLGGGGISSILKITSVIAKIPGWAWVVLLVIFIFRRWGKK